MTVKPVLVPAGLAASTVCAVASIQLRAPIPVRFIAVLVALVLVPGLAVTYRVNAYRRYDDAIRSATALPFAFGMAWLVLATEVLVYAQWWKPGALIPATTAFAALLVVTSAQGAHLRRRASRERLWIWGISAIGCWFVALQAWSIYRAPYRIEELGSIQTAWIRAESTPGQLGRASGSAISILLEAVVPFRRSTFGTLLAARWLALGLFGVAIVFAVSWGRSLAKGPNLVLAFAAMVGACSIVQVDVLSGVTAVSTPLLLASGVCLAGRSRLSGRFALAGGLLTLGAVSSRTGFGAAIGLGLWLVLDAQSWPAIRGVARNRFGALTAGLLGTLTVAIVCSRIFSVPFPVLHGHPVSIATGKIPALQACGWLVLLATGALLVDIAVARPSRSRRHRINRHHAPLITLIGAGFGASVEGLPLLQVAPLLLLLSVLSITGLLFSPDSGFARLVRSQRAVNAVHEVVPRARLTLFGLVTLVLLLAGLQTVRVARLSNRQQTSQMAYILERTTALDAVYDPSGEVGVLRPRAEHKAIGRAAFAVVPGDTARDRELRKTLIAAGFTRTTQPGVWARVLQWSTNPPVAVLPDEGLQWSTNPPVAVLPYEASKSGSGSSLDWAPPVLVYNEALSVDTGGKG